MSNECKCTNPDGGGTKCPVQHVALCIRGKDKECYGECIPIPRILNVPSNRFYQWLNQNIEYKVSVYTEVNYASEVKFFPLRKASDFDLSARKVKFIIGNKGIDVSFSFEFRNDIEPLDWR